MAADDPDNPNAVARKERKEQWKKNKGQTKGGQKGKAQKGKGAGADGKAAAKKGAGKKDHGKQADTGPVRVVKFTPPGKDAKGAGKAKKQ